MKNKKVKGISLIVLVITIIIIIILAGAVLLSIANNNPITQATKAVFVNDVRSFQSELALYHGKQFAEKLGKYNIVLVQADETSLTYGDNVDNTKSINDTIPSLGATDKYTGEFEVINGELVYKGNDENKKEWASEIGMPVTSLSKVSVTIFPPSPSVVEPGTDISYTARFSSNAAISTIDLTGKVEVIDKLGNVLPLQPYIVFESTGGTEADLIREMKLTIKTAGLSVGEYRIIIKSGAVADVGGKTNTSDITSLHSFEVTDENPPENPIITATPSGWTNGDVTISVEYSEDTAVKQYSLDTITWNTYIDTIKVNTNNTTIYARGLDAASNESGVSTITISNIDKVPPVVTAGDGGKTTSSITVTASASDLESGLNIASYQYSIDDGNTWTTATSQTSYTFNTITTGTYSCKVKVLDIAGNAAISNSISITTTSLGTITLSPNPSGWTNGNVTVTITYPSEIVTRQYSLNGTTWNTYTAAVSVSSNNTVVYAKGIDSGGNQTSQASITISNIDIIAPTVSFGTNGAVVPSTASTTVNISDTGGSAVNSGTLQYIWDTQNVNAPSSGWLTFTNGSTISKSGVGIYYLWIKANDNAGNNITTKSNKFTIGEVESIASTPQTTNKTYSGGTSGFSYNNPVIPAGFVAVNTSSASWDSLSSHWGKGLVIQDASGNQFVWVPVDGGDVPYAKRDYKGATIAGAQLYDGPLPTGFIESKITTTYKGFYIGRYESRFEYNGGNIRVGVKKSLNSTYDDWSSSRNATYNGYVWNYISGADAKYHADNMANMYGYDTSKVITNLVTGQQWDATLEWLKWYNFSAYDSKRWGNYSDSTAPANVSGYGGMQISGYNTAWRANNIYDLAGNFNEFTNEMYSTTGKWHVHRGGSFSDGGFYNPAGMRSYANAVANTYVFDSITFRVALFVK